MLKYVFWFVGHTLKSEVYICNSIFISSTDKNTFQCWRMPNLKCPLVCDWHPRKSWKILRSYRYLCFPLHLITVFPPRQRSHMKGLDFSKFIRVPTHGKFLVLSWSLSPRPISILVTKIYPRRSHLMGGSSCVFWHEGFSCYAFSCQPL